MGVGSGSGDGGGEEEGEGQRVSVLVLLQHVVWVVESFVLQQVLSFIVGVVPPMEPQQSLLFSSF